MRILLSIPIVALLLSPLAARACMSPDWETYAFTLGIPRRDADTVIVRLRIDRMRAGKAEGVLVTPFDRFPGVERVVVATALGNSCARWGITEGEVYAVVTNARIENGTLYFDAPQRRDPLLPPQRRPDLDAYIVDPAYRTGGE